MKITIYLNNGYKKSKGQSYGKKFLKNKQKPTTTTTIYKGN